MINCKEKKYIVLDATHKNGYRKINYDLLNIALRNYYNNNRKNFKLFYGNAFAFYLFCLETDLPRYFWNEVKPYYMRAIKRKCGCKTKQKRVKIK